MNSRPAAVAELAMTSGESAGYNREAQHTGPGRPIGVGKTARRMRRDDQDDQEKPEDGIAAQIEAVASAKVVSTAK